MVLRAPQPAICPHGTVCSGSPAPPENPGNLTFPGGSPDAPQVTTFLAQGLQNEVPDLLLPPKWPPKWSLKSSKIKLRWILKTMLSCTRELHFHILGTSRMESKLDPESGSRETSHFWCLKVQKLSQGAQRLPKGSPKRSQQRSKIYQKSTKILPEATPDAQGYPKRVKCTISGHPGVHFGTILDENANKSWASDLKLSRWKIPAAKKMRALLPTFSWSRPTLLQAEYLDIQAISSKYNKKCSIHPWGILEPEHIRILESWNLRILES